jgi:hypothetical protein
VEIGGGNRVLAQMAEDARTEKAVAGEERWSSTRMRAAAGGQRRQGAVERREEQQGVAVARGATGWRCSTPKANVVLPLQNA